ncbi:MAG: response regulator [Candidatus Acidiferrales bacterium]
MNAIRVLIVDDSAVMRKIVQRCLREAGIEIAQILEAGNGVQGLAALQDGPVDLIFSDVNMPAMDGLEFLQALRSIQHAKDTPVVMIASESDEARAVEALSAGARSYIRRPLSPEQIRSRVAPLLDRPN